MTRKARYGPIMDDLQMIGYRNMLCGMHVHVAVQDIDTGINLIMRLTPYLQQYVMERVDVHKPAAGSRH